MKHWRRWNFARRLLPVRQQKVPAIDPDPFFFDTAEQTFWYTKRGKIFVLFYVFFIVIALEVGVFMYIIGSTPPKAPAKPPQNAAAVNPTVLPTPMGPYTITILNGSGITGRAAEIKGLLEGEKLTVRSVGNASSFTNKTTSIQVRTGIPEEFVLKLRNILAKRYVLNDTVSYSAEIDASDILIIAGKETPPGDTR